jgi:integrase/recombinase XerD
MMLDGSQPGSHDDRSDVTPEVTTRTEVMFLDELSALLRVSRATIERRRRQGAFPIPELEPLDRRPRWSRRAVDRYLTSGVVAIRRGRGPAIERRTEMKNARVTAVVARGIYKLDDGSFRVVAHAGNSRVNQRRKEKRFPPATGVREMKRWQNDVRATFQRDGLRLQRDTLAADVPRFMRVMEQRLICADHRDNEIRAWLPRFGQRRRHTIDTEDVRQQVMAWEAEGLAASTINHRLSALSQLYKVLDGEKSYNPVPAVRRLREPLAKPDGRSPETIQRVFAALEQRVTAQNRGWRTLARLKVIALTGMRHSQVMRLEPDHLYVDHNPPYVVVVDPGKDGEPHAKPLTADGVEACRLFRRVEAWGKFSQSSLYKSWKSACTVADVPFFNPYKLRHSYATALRAQGMDLADVQELMGHKSAKTTQRYAMVAPKKLAAAAELLHQAWHPPSLAGDLDPKTKTKTGT